MKTQQPGPRTLRSRPAGTVRQMTTYTTLHGQVLDLGSLTEEQHAFLARCYRAYRDGVDWVTFSNLVASTENPLIRDAGGWITPEVWHHPLFRAVRDLEGRLGIQQDYIAQEPDDDSLRDPLTREPTPAHHTAR